MTNVFRAEMLKLTRPRTLIFALAAVAVAALIATSVTFLSADSGGGAAEGRAPSLADLAAAGGGSEAFALGMSFMGFFVFVVMTANWTGEFSQGTFRTLLMKQPRRVALLGGKLAALVTFAAGLLVVSAIATWVLSLGYAPTQDVSTSEWFSIDGLWAAIESYGSAVISVSAWSVFAMMLAVLVRSTPLALGIGIAWAGPFEHITMDAIDAASGIYPGLLLEALAVGGTDDVSYARALTLVAVYAAIAAVIATINFTRRDVAG